MPTCVLALSDSGVILHASPSASQVLGYSSASLLQLPVESLIHSKDKATWRLAWSGLGPGDAGRRRMRLQCRHADHGWSGCRARLARAANGAITLRLDTEADAALLLYRDLAEQYPEGLLLFDPATLYLRRCNAAARRMLGAEGQRLRGHSIYELLPVPVDVLREAIEGCVNHACNLGRVQLAASGDDGGPETQMAVEVRMARFDSGFPAGLLVGMRPWEERLAEEAQWHQAQKMQELGSMAGTLAHDFNNLATVILSYSDQLLMEGPDDVRQAASEISEAARSAASLCQRLLGISRGQIPEMRPLDLNQALTTMAPLFSRLLRPDIKLEISAASEPTGIRGDPGQIEQLILNLVTNARDAMPRGGQLRIAVGRQSVRGGAGAGAHRVPPGEYATLTVSDTGVGMDAETQRRIFEPFFTTKGSAGTGLGLASVQSIVQASGGFINVSSRPNQGSRFTVLFPLVEAVSQPV